MQRLMYAFRQALLAPSRTPRMAVAIGRLLGSAFIICFLTGLYSHFIQDPVPGMWFPTRPIWLYQVSQGIHITSGILCFPLIFAKLYAVFPELFRTPPISGFSSFVERASITLFISSSLVEITIGLLNTFQAYKIFAFPFRQTHYTLSFIIIGSLAIHIAFKLHLITRYWRKKDSYDENGDFIPEDRPAEAVSRMPLPDVGVGYTSRIFNWIDRVPEPRSQKLSRRGFGITIGAAAATILALTGGQSFALLNFANVFAPRKNGTGPNALPVNRTASAAKVMDTAMSPDWTLTVTAGSTSKAFSRSDLEAMTQYQVDLPIACVEGWSQMAHWTGPRLRDLMDSVGAKSGSKIRATSLEKGSIYAVTEMESNFVRDELTLVALKVDGKTLDIDHGYPARMIAPARPGVLQTKWLSKIEEI